MTSLIPIIGTKTTNDSFYRYKMNCPIVIKSKTFYIFTNIHLIATEISRDVKILANFLQNRLTCSCSLKDDGFYTKAEITNKQILDEINLFIDNFILCQKCENPETVLNNSSYKCNACGHITNIHSSKITSKTLDFITKFQKDQKKKTKNDKKLKKLTDKYDKKDNIDDELLEN